MDAPYDDMICEYWDDEKGCLKPDCSHYSEKHPGNCNYNMTKEEEESYAKGMTETATFDAFPNIKNKQNPPSQEGE